MGFLFFGALHDEADSDEEGEKRQHDQGELYCFHFELLVQFDRPSESVRRPLLVFLVLRLLGLLDSVKFLLGRPVLLAFRVKRALVGRLYVSEDCKMRL